LRHQRVSILTRPVPVVTPGPRRTPARLRTRRRRTMPSAKAAPRRAPRRPSP